MECQKTELGVLVDKPLDEFKEEYDQKPLGEVSGLLNYFQTLYAGIVGDKDTLVQKVGAEVDASKTKEIMLNIQNLYVVLFRLESKIVYLKDRYAELTKKEV